MSLTMQSPRHASPSRGTRCACRLLSLVLLPVLSASAQAGAEQVETAHVRATLVSEVAEIVPHGGFWVGLHFELRDGWHTYWTNPGDSGLAATVEWELPGGVVAGEIRWPIPQRFRTAGLMSFGYADEVVLLTRMSAWPEIREASTVSLVARVNWLVCEEVCIPEQGRFELSLPVTGTAPPAESRHRALIERYAALLPESPRSAPRFRGSKDHLRLRVPLPEDWPRRTHDVWFYPLQYGDIEHGAPQPAIVESGEVVLTLKRGEFKGQSLTRLRGVLVLRFSDDVKGISIDAAPE